MLALFQTTLVFCLNIGSLIRLCTHGYLILFKILDDLTFLLTLSVVLIFVGGGISIGRVVALQAKGFQFKSEFLH
jgi:hypothetical protein